MHSDQNITFHYGNTNINNTSPYIYSVTNPNVTLNFTTVFQPIVITGAVFTELGQVLKFAKVYLYNATYTLVDSTVSSFNGSYQLTSDSLAIGNDYYLKIRPNTNSLWAENQLSSYYNNQHYLIDADVITTNQRVTNIDVNTFETRTLSGTITTSTNTILSNSWVYLYDFNGNLSDSTLTDNSGQYSINTTFDSVYVQVVPNTNFSSQLPTFYNNTTTIANAMMVSFINYQATVNFSTLLRPNTVQGNLTTSDGAILDNTSIYLYDTNGNIVDSTISDNNGQYIFSTMLSSIYLKVVPNTNFPSQLPTFYDGTETFVNAATITFTNYLATIDFSTLPRPNIVEGIITTSTNLALSNSWIYLIDNNENRVDSIQTDANGMYQFETLLDSIYLQAAPNSTYSQELPTYFDGVETFATATAITFTNHSAMINFSTIYLPNTIIGTITRSDGFPLDNSWVYLIDTSMANIDSTLSTTQGDYSFVISDISINYYIKANPGSNHGDQVITYYNSSETIQTADSVDILSVINIANFSTIDTINATGGKTIGGVVSLGTDFVSTPLADVRMILKDSNGNFINDAITDDNGKFKFYNLANGTYKILVDKVGIDNNLAPIIELKDGESSPENLEFLLHSYYLEMFYPTSTVEVFNVENITIYPNPIQTTFTIEYDLTAFANIQIDILDVNGKIVSTIINENQMAGKHLINVNKTEALNTGVYFVRMIIDGQSVIRKLIKQ